MARSKQKNTFGGIIVKAFSAIYHFLWMVLYHVRFIVCGVIVFLLLFSTFVWQVGHYLEGKSVWNISIADRDFSLATRDEIYTELEDRFTSFLDSDVLFRGDGSNVAIPLRELGVSYDVEKMVDSVMRVGDSDTIVEYVLFALSTLFSETQLPVIYSFDEDVMTEAVNAALPSVTEAYDAYVTSIDGEFVIVPEQVGFGLDFIDARQRVDLMAQTLDIMDVYLASVDIQPEWVASDFEPALTLMESLTEKPLVISLGEEVAHTIRFSEDINWFDFHYGMNGLNSYMEVSLNEERLGQVAEKIRNMVDAPEDVRLVLDDAGNYLIEGLPVHGEEVVMGDFISDVYKALNDGTYALSYDVIEKKATVVTDLEDDGGIRDLLAVGTSYFAGSSADRLHNVTTGLSKINGVLLTPGYEFSFTEFLGPVNGDTGYKKELVIKSGGRVTPEYGGGLCQVSTTTYRAALNAGMPITERRNHSFSVKYYDPVGTDATIYPPYTDMKFVNETDANMYIQAHVDPETYTAYVFLYGTDDGRKVENFRSAAPYGHYTIPDPVYIDVDWLPAGERRLVDHGSAKEGFEVRWGRRVTMPDGEVRSDSFYSHYRAFPAYYYRGR